MSFRLEAVEQGVDLVVTGPWSRKAEKYVQSGRADGLALNYAWGFNEPDLRFLIGLPLSRLMILDRKITDLEPISTLGNLRSLSVQTDPRAVVNLECLPKLTSLGAAWSQVRDTIGAVGPLEDLYLARYSEADFTPLSGLSSLASLVMKDYPGVRSLDGLPSLANLQRLEVHVARQLEDIRALRETVYPHLERLHFSHAKRVVDLEALEGLQQLRMLEFSDGGDVTSLKPLEGLRNLEYLYLFGSTRVVDGDLRPVLGLPKLVDFRLQSRRHYTPSVAQVKEAVGNRNGPLHCTTAS